MKKAVFSQPWGGLGDNLAFTNLPRLYSESGIDFYVSFMNYSRNQDIHNLCWRNNDNVKRFKKLIPNIGFKTFEESGYKVFNKKFNSVQNTNVTHGFDPGLGYPEIKLDSHIKSPINESFHHVIDLQAYSIFNDSEFTYNKKSFQEKINYYTSKSSHSLTYPNLYTPHGNTKNKLEIKNLNELISILLNTNTFVCLNSGSHVLASTLKHLTGYPKKIVSFNNLKDIDVEIKNEKILIKKGHFYFDNVNYEKIDIERKDTQNLEYEESQNIPQTMNKNLQRHRKLFNYQKRFETIFQK